MKIAILSPFSPYRGGIAQFSGMLYNSLDAAGVEVKAFNFSRLYPDLLFPGKTQYVDPKEETLPIPSVRTLDSINPLSYFRTVEAIKAFDPDVLIISYWMSFFVPAYAHIANRMKKNCKVITLIHNAIPHEPRFFDQPLATLLFKQCAGFVVLSEQVASDLKKMHPKANYLLTPHPLYTHFGAKIDATIAKQQLGLDVTKKTLLFFGLIRDYKGLDLLIDAFTQLDEGYQLLIAGECYGSFDKYQQQIAQSGAASRIHVCNQYIADSEIATYFSAADALILPYRTATQSGVLSVAYHFDLPVVSTPVGDFPNSIGTTAVGIVVPEITAASLTEGIESLFAPNQMAYFHAQIVKHKTALSWEVLTERLCEFIPRI